MAKLNVTDTLAASIKTLMAPVASHTGSIWTATRDAYALALADFPEASDAAGAVRQVAKEAGVNINTIKVYMATLQFLARPEGSKGGGAGLAADQIAKLSGSEAEAIQHPKPFTPADGDKYLKQEADKAAAKVAALEAKKREEAEKVAANPKLAAIKAITDILETMNEDELKEVFELIGKPEQVAGKVAEEVAEREAA